MNHLDDWTYTEIDKSGGEEPIEAFFVCLVVIAER